jgi:uncharacterized protein
VLLEPEHEQLRAELGRWPGHVSSALLAVEGVRACVRYGRPYASAAREGLASVALLPLDEPLLAQAATLAPPTLRTLDALHLASALSIGTDLGVLLVYDTRLRQAAVDAGLPVASPGSAAHPGRAP